ncbi:hypothetical protein DTO027B5_7315 [Paecilomyces variotii]|nr:hypothetical protein DTO027B3_2057 [Paecilomyces variotii]KAJ9330888.1 hypothetical protein DTO027B5_7315 [Paecilomyces variotii]
MSRPFPYTYISCPCADDPIPDPSSKRISKELSPRKKGSSETPQFEEDSDEEEVTFDPRSPRANFSLYPPEQLLYCEDCHQIKCPRCITEEIVCWYCPNCLFETPSSMVRSEGNRCARNCFNCPICTAPLAVTTLENTAAGGSHQGPWVLACQYCMWTTLDIGIKFDKPTNIRTQLAKLTEAAGGRKSTRGISDMRSPLASFSSTTDLPVMGESEEVGKESKPVDEQPPLDPDARFDALKSFYRNQIAETSSSPSDPLGTDLGAGFSSPSALNRIMSLYASSTFGGLYGAGGKKPKSKPPVMREALHASEGLKIPSPDFEESIINRMSSDECGWDGLASMEQRAFQALDARFVEDLRPLPVQLRTKRSKRCKACKHILVKPEFKPQSTRFRIRLIALSYIPLPTLRPLTPTSIAGIPLSPTVAPPDLDALPPLRPIQYLLTLKNHMFDPVRVTLATPSLTPGRVATKVTILCPQFDIGANSDVWDEALQASTAGDRSSRAALAGFGTEKVAEAGKVWDKGRNWTTVVIEIVPGTLPGSGHKSRGDHEDNDDRHTASDDGNDNDDDNENDNDNDSNSGNKDNNNNDEELRDDEDVLEIPVFVRLEWDTENQIEQPVGKNQKPEMVKRELAYWMVLGVGRIKDGES